MFQYQRFSQQRLRSVFGSLGATELMLILAIIAVPAIVGITLAVILLWHFRKREKDTD